MEVPFTRHGSVHTLRFRSHFNARITRENPVRRSVSRSQVKVTIKGARSRLHDVRDPIHRWDVPCTGVRSRTQVRSPVHMCASTKQARTLFIDAHRLQVRISFISGRPVHRCTPRIQVHTPFSCAHPIHMCTPNL